MRKFVLVTACAAALGFGLVSGAQAQPVCPPGIDCRGLVPHARQPSSQTGDQAPGMTRMDRQNPGLRQMQEHNRHPSWRNGQRAHPDAPHRSGKHGAGKHGSSKHGHANGGQGAWAKGHHPSPKPHQGSAHKRSPQAPGPQVYLPEWGGN